MRIVVCEDELIYQRAITDGIGRWQAASGHMDVEMSVYSSSEDLLERLDRDAKVDLLFIDIQIPGEMNGIELARKIREKHLDMTIVFCTNYSEYVFEGYTVHALRFLKKPVVQEDIDFCCGYVYDRLALQSDQTLTVISSGKRYALRHMEILCIEAKLHSLLISTTVRSDPLRITAKFSDIQRTLPESQFVQCHRSYIINIAHVRMLTRTECTLSNGISIPISRTYAAGVEQAFDGYHQGGGVNHALVSI